MPPTLFPNIHLPFLDCIKLSMRNVLIYFLFSEQKHAQRSQLNAFDVGEALVVVSMGISRILGRLGKGSYLQFLLKGLRLVSGSSQDSGFTSQDTLNRPIRPVSIAFQKVESLFVFFFFFFFCCTLMTQHYFSYPFICPKLLLLLQIFFCLHWIRCQLFYKFIFLMHFFFKSWQCECSCFALDECLKRGRDLMSFFSPPYQLFVLQASGLSEASCSDGSHTPSPAAPATATWPNLTDSNLQHKSASATGLHTLTDRPHTISSGKTTNKCRQKILSFQHLEALERIVF